jgi:hypothetical protein
MARVPLMPTSQSASERAARRVGQRQHLRVGAQVCKTVADRLGRHALQPQALDGFLEFAPRRLRVLQDQAKDQLTLAPGVAGVDDVLDVLAADQLDQRV